MSSDIEESGKHAIGHMKEHTSKDGADQNKVIAIASMIMALLSAVGALLADITANEILIGRTEQIIERQRMETARMKVEVLRTKVALLEAMGKPVDVVDQQRIGEYRSGIGEVKFETESDEAKVGQAILEHGLFAIGVTILSVAITLSGLSVDTSRRGLFTVGVVIGLIGAGFLGGGVYTMFW